MKELLLYTNTLKEIIDSHNGKEYVWYHDGEWYSREHSRIITPEELCEWVLKLARYDDDYEDPWDNNDRLECGCCACCGCSCDD